MPGFDKYLDENSQHTPEWFEMAIERILQSAEPDRIGPLNSRFQFCAPFESGLSNEAWGRIRRAFLLAVSKEAGHDTQGVIASVKDLIQKSIAGDPVDAASWIEAQRLALNHKNAPAAMIAYNLSVASQRDDEHAGLAATMELAIDAMLRLDEPHSRPSMTPKRESLELARKARICSRLGHALAGAFESEIELSYKPNGN